jgi:hypothetical protein
VTGRYRGGDERGRTHKTTDQSEVWFDAYLRAHDYKWEPEQIWTFPSVLIGSAAATV